MSMGYGPEFQHVLRPNLAEGESNYPETNDSTIALLRQLIEETKKTRLVNESPTLGQYDLSPDAANTPNGRLFLPQATRMRFSQLVIFAVGVITFTLKTGESPKILFPALTAGNTTIALPVAIVLERGSTLQLQASAATWAGWIIGFPEPE